MKIGKQLRFIVIALFLRCLTKPVVQQRLAAASEIGSFKVEKRRRKRS